MELADIQIRDPFVLVEHGEGAYYLFGSTDPIIWAPPGIGFDCYRSTDLVRWDGPLPAFRPPAGFWSPGRYWAPEAYRVGDAWFLFATFTGDAFGMGTQVLRAERPQGPYLPWSDGPVTPRGWTCLDGTLFIDASGPWMVFCHEWTQVGDGEVCAIRLTDDLRASTGEPLLLFHASDAGWTKSIGEVEVGGGKLAAYVTDGPFLHSAGDGTLLMLWSSFGEQGYAMGVARSTTGVITGPWEQSSRPLWAADGGHGMVFHTLDGRLMMTLHQPNTTPAERAVFVEVHEASDADGRCVLSLPSPTGREH